MTSGSHAGICTYYSHKPYIISIKYSHFNYAQYINLNFDNKNYEHF